MFDLATLSILVAVGIVTALNPSSISLFLMVAASIYGKGHSTKRLAWYGTLYLIGMLVIVCITTLMLWGLVSLVPITFRSYLAIVLSTILIVAGLIEVKDYFWYGKKFILSPPKKMLHTVHNLARKMNRGIEYGLLGMYSGLILVPYISFSLLAIAMIASVGFPFHAVSFIAAFSIILLAPLFVLLFCVICGIRFSMLIKWKEDSKATMRLTTGVLLIFLGWFITLLAGGLIRLG